MLFWTRGWQWGMALSWNVGIRNGPRFWNSGTNLLSHSVMCAKSSNLSSLDLVDTISFFVSATDSWGGMKWCVSRQNLFSCCGIMQQQVSEPGNFNGWTFRGTEIVQTTLGGTVQWPVRILEPERYLWWSDEQNCLHVHWWCRPSKVHGTSWPRPSNSLPQCKATSTKTEDSWYMGL